VTRAGLGCTVVAALVGAAALLPACRRESPPPWVETIRVGGGTLQAAQETGLDEAAIEALARAALAEAGFAKAPSEGPAHRLRLDLTTLRLGPGPGGRGMSADVAVELDLVPTKGDQPSLRERGAGGAQVGAAGPAVAVRAAMSQALGEAARGLRLALGAEVKPLPALLADLDSSDRRVREHAVQALGERRDPGAVPALIKRLGDSDPQVVHRTIGALALIKDQRAVPALIDLSRGGDATITLRLVHLVADIGGRDAQGWLSNLEVAHSDPRVRQEATEALAGMARAAAPSGLAGPASAAAPAPAR